MHPRVASSLTSRMSSSSRLGAHRFHSRALAPQVASASASASAARLVRRYGTSRPLTLRSHALFARRQTAPRRLAARSFGVQVQNLADIGEGIVEVEILEWFKQPGDKVQQFDKICSVQSDKANVDITSRYDGTLKTTDVPVGEMAQVGAPLFTIDDGGASAEASPTASPSSSEAPSSSPPAASSASSSSSPPAATGAAAGGKVLTTPAVRALAKQHSLDLSLITPTGPKGRLTKEDVLNYVEGTESEAEASASLVAALQSSSPVPQPAGDEDYGAHLQQPLISKPAAPEDKVIKVRGLRRAMVQSMTKSSEIPQFLYTDEVRADAVMAVRRDLKPVLAERGVRLTLMPFFIKAASLALLQFPILNSTVSDDLTEINQIGRHNISVAMDSPHGLIVPNIKDCNALSVAEIASELARLQTLSTEGKLGKEDLADGTFSLSNIGSVGGTVMHPIVFVPQVAIGALGKIRQIPQYDDNMNLIPTQVMHASWSADHRIIDGATMARFANLWKLYVEQPHRMVMDMR